MSGGAFDYDQYKILEIAEQISHDVNRREQGKYDDWEEPFSDETMVELHNAAHALHKAYVYAQRVDWLLSGDDGEDSFHKRLKEDLTKL